VRLAGFYLILLVSQGFLGALMAPVPPPDLFLIGVLTLLYRIPAWQLVLLGYAAGLLQDVLGHGSLGVHALGLAAAALVASTVRAQLSGQGVLERALAVFAAVAGKWVVMGVLLVWLSDGVNPWGSVATVAALDAALTVAVALLLLPWGFALLSRSDRNRGSVFR
jgi:rod shape-determining protein MreD